ncbi:hypothetical protein MKX03_010703 [Papaver bracteatum]|nr:hypothetical protein MKX03_010703 [Papaver bracteatum]
MQTYSSSHFILLSVLVLYISLGNSSSIQSNFLQCLSQQSETSIPVYTPNSAYYTTILENNIHNLRLLSPTNPKPYLIVTPLLESHVQASVVCSRKNKIQIKIRSGGHDFDGLSYLSDVPFVMVDLNNLRSVTIDCICPTVGVGGHFSGGGCGTMLRSYGLAAYQVIDARIVNVGGEILNKATMGKDLFGAIKGGGGGSFGVVLSWRVKLVLVPPIVTVFTIVKTVQQGATRLVDKWQDLGYNLPTELFIRVLLDVVNADGNGNKTVRASFNSLYLGSMGNLSSLMKQRFPELGLEHTDCTEMSWIQSTLYFWGFPVNGPLENLLDRTDQPKLTFKGKSDYVKAPIPTKNTLFPYGGKMNEISESSTPFPHRQGNLYKILYVVRFEDLKETEERLSWIRKLYEDVDIGQSTNGTATYLQGKVWGGTYFKDNYDRLVRVKTKADPANFFRNEQSIPSVAND